MPLTMASTCSCEKRFEDGLGRAGLGHQLLNLGVGGGLGLLGAGAALVLVLMMFLVGRFGDDRP